MNTKESFLQAASFQHPERIPNYELGVWQQTWDRWFSEGLSSKVLRNFEKNDGLFFGEPFFRIDGRQLNSLPHLGIFPGFKEEQIEENDDYIIFRDGTGVVHKALKAGMVRNYRMSMDQYLEFPVRTPDDFADIKEHLDPSTPGRYPDGWEANLPHWKNRDYLLCSRGFGYYSFLRSLMGTEGLSIAFYEQPQLIEEICDCITHLFINVTEMAFEKVGLDYFEFHEDFAYKGAPLISPDFFRRFIKPHYVKLIEYMKCYDVPLFFVDSDGDPTQLIPDLIDAGINGLWPLERAAGVDPHRLRAEFGKELVLFGGVDKRALAKDKTAIYDDIKYLAPLVEEGGCIPTVDHIIPPDISYENFFYYLDLKEKVLQGRNLGSS